VKSRTNIAAAITQWNARATSEWRGIRTGEVLARGFEPIGFCRVAFAMRGEHHVAGVGDEKHEAGKQ
jgi:hypothetical protein